MNETPSQPPKFRVGQWVEHLEYGFQGKIKSVVWEPKSHYNFQTHQYDGGYIVSLETGNYGGESHFRLII